MSQACSSSGPRRHLRSAPVRNATSKRRRIEIDLMISISFRFRVLGLSPERAAAPRQYSLNTGQPFFCILKNFYFLCTTSEMFLQCPWSVTPLWRRPSQCQVTHRCTPPLVTALSEALHQTDAFIHCPMAAGSRAQQGGLPPRRAALRLSRRIYTVGWPIMNVLPR